MILAAADAGSGGWVPVSHMGDLAGVSSSWLWQVNQWMGTLSNEISKNLLKRKSDGQRSTCKVRVKVSVIETPMSPGRKTRKQVSSSSIPGGRGTCMEGTDSFSPRRPLQAEALLVNVGDGMS